MIDTYVTKVKANHFTEIACYVRGKSSSSVIIGAAPTADWAKASGPLMRAVAAFQVRLRDRRLRGRESETMAQKTSVPRARTGRPAGLSDVMLLASVRKPELRDRGNLFITALVLRLAGAGLLAWIGYIHWVLWQTEGYKFIPTDGPFFLVDAIAGVALAAALLFWPRPLAGLVSAGFVAGTILALVISLTVGLLGFNESISAYYVVLALVVESITLVILLAWTALVAWLVPGRS